MSDPANVVATHAAPRRAHHARWIARRIVTAALTLVVVSIIVFAATQVLPGDAAKAILGREATPERLSELRQQLGLDRPVVEQYFSWLGDFLRGDLGTSLTQSQMPVSDYIGDRLVNSAALVLVTLVIAAPVSILLGIAAARRRDRAFDHATSTGTMVLNALPEFAIGLILVVMFATSVWKVLPPVALFPVGDNPLAHPRELALPVITLVLASVPYLTRLVRGSLIDVLDSDYIQMARLKGLSERRLLYRHALPNALIPAVQGLALIAAFLAGGIVAVEYLFRFPGIGSALREAVTGRDLPMVQATTLILGTVYILVNLIADIATVLLTPKLRTEGR